MSREKILIIDDEKDFRDSVRQMLESEDYEVAAAADGEEGLTKTKDFKPDLVICDVKMPKKDGFEVLKRVREDLKISSPFIMLTALDDFKKVKEAYEDKADFYLTKPVDPFMLLKNIRTLLNLYKSKIK